MEKPERQKRLIAHIAKQKSLDDTQEKWRQSSEKRSALALEGLLLALKTNIERIDLIEGSFPSLDAEIEKRKQEFWKKNVRKKEDVPQAIPEIRKIRREHDARRAELFVQLAEIPNNIAFFRTALEQELEISTIRGHVELVNQYAVEFIETLALLEQTPDINVESKIEVERKVAHVKQAIIDIWKPIRTSVEKLMHAGQDVLPALKEALAPRKFAPES